MLSSGVDFMLLPLSHRTVDESQELFLMCDEPHITFNPDVFCFSSFQRIVGYLNEPTPTPHSVHGRLDERAQSWTRNPSSAAGNEWSSCTKPSELSGVQIEPHITTVLCVWWRVTDFTGRKPYLRVYQVLLIRCILHPLFPPCMPLRRHRISCYFQNPSCKCLCEISGEDDAGLMCRIISWMRASFMHALLGHNSSSI